MASTRPPFAILGAVGAGLATVFAAISTHDYAQHLDRQLHAVHCSFIPGAMGDEGKNACSTAMYSPYSAVMRSSYWGGIPLALLGLGTFVFVLVASLYLARKRPTRAELYAYAGLTLVPLLSSLVMFIISMSKLGSLCKLCVGMYVGSAVIAYAGVLAFQRAREPQESFGSQPPPASPLSNWIPAATAAVGLGLFTLVPALVYAASIPDYSSKMMGCGKLLEREEKHGALLKMRTTNPVKSALMFEDPLCPTCKSVHERLVSEGIYDRLDVSSAMFPLDNDCNEMLDRAMHPGACVVAKAVICGDKAGQSRQILEWAYEHQEELVKAGKLSKDSIRSLVRGKFPDVDACIDAKTTKQRLDQMLQFAVTNKIPVSTPQVYLDSTRICDEDTDLGLSYTMKKLAPEVMP